MLLCKINSEKICEECLKPIEKEEECLRFYNKRKIRFRHFHCQYYIRERKISFEEWIESIRFMSNMQVINRVRKEAIKYSKPEKIKEYVERKEKEWNRHKEVLKKLEILKQLQGGS